MAEGKRILNVDETPIGYSNLHDKAWMPKDLRWTKNINQLQPRVTMIAAIDDYGQIYYTLM